MLERTDARTNEVLEPITFVLAYPTVYSSTTNAHSETGQMAVCYLNLKLGALSIRSTLSVLIEALFKQFGLFLNTPRIYTLKLPVNP